MSAVAGGIGGQSKTAHVKINSQVPIRAHPKPRTEMNRKFLYMWSMKGFDKLGGRSSYTQHLCPTQDTHLVLISDGAHVFGCDKCSILSIVLLIAVLHTGAAPILDASE